MYTALRCVIFGIFAIIIVKMFHIQVISRGQIQYWTSVNVDLNASPLKMDEFALVAPMQDPVSPFTVRGEFVLPLVLPSTVSPSVHVSTDLLILCRYL